MAGGGGVAKGGGIEIGHGMRVANIHVISEKVDPIGVEQEWPTVVSSFYTGIVGQSVLVSE